VVYTDWAIAPPSAKADKSGAKWKNTPENTALLPSRASSRPFPLPRVREAYLSL